MLEGIFPFFPMRFDVSAVFFKSLEMSYFMYQGNQKPKGVWCGIQRDPVPAIGESLIIPMSAHPHIDDLNIYSEVGEKLITKTNSVFRQVFLQSLIHPDKNILYKHSNSIHLPISHFTKPNICDGRIEHGLQLYGILSAKIPKLRVDQGVLLDT